MSMKKIFTISISLFVLTLLFAFNKLNSGGVIGTTGSPSEGLCTGCHGGGAGTTTISITSTPAFSANTYSPGTLYSVTITVGNSSFSRFGFDCEILTASNTNAGTMSGAGSGAQFFNFSGKKNVTHTTPKTGTASASWTFNWAAPANGDATFYVAGNAVNLDGGTNGDKPGSTAMTISAPIGTGIQTVSKNNLSAISIFPNPASDFMNVSYVLASQENVSIEIMEINGKLVKTLVNEAQEPGPHSQITDLKGIPKGIYFVRTSIGGEKASQKLISIQ
jgi:hypothetical protein